MTHFTSSVEVKKAMEPDRGHSAQEHWAQEDDPKRVTLKITSVHCITSRAHNFEVSHLEISLRGQTALAKTSRRKLRLSPRVNTRYRYDFEDFEDFCFLPTLPYHRHWYV